MTVRVAVAELAGSAEAPAAHGARREQGARVSATRRDLRDGTADVHVAGGRGRFVVADAVRIAVAEAPVGAVAPAANGPTAQDGTRVRRACGHLNHRASHRHVARGSGRLVVTDGVLIAVAEASERSEPPAAKSPALEHRAIVLVTGRYLERPSYRGSRR